MDLYEVFAAVRNHYVDGYQQVLDESRSGEVTYVPEVLLEVGDKGIFSLYRADFLCVEGENRIVREVNLASHVTFEPFLVESGGASFVVNPFQWNGVEVSVQPGIAETTAVEKWAMRWIDEADSHMCDPDELGGVVHSVLEPQLIDGCLEFSLDLGSAATESLVELIDVLISIGAKSIEIHSRTILAAKS